MRDLRVVVLVDADVLIPGTLRFCPGMSDRHVVEGLRRIVREVVVKPFSGFAELEAWLTEHPPDLVFNVTEHVDGDRAKDFHVCALLDRMRIPYTGPGPRGLMLCRDKAVSKLIARDAGFHTPAYFVTSARRRTIPDGVTFPVLVKPRHGDASEGITASGLVATRAALARRIEQLARAGVDDTICEQYVVGREIVVNFVGDRVLRPREFLLRHDAPGEHFIASERFKMNPRVRARWLDRVDFARLTTAQLAQIEALTLRVAEALELRHYGRLDLRLTPAGDWTFLEANPNPSLIDPRRTWSGTWKGIRHRDLLAEILRCALGRPAVSRRRGSGIRR